jgi:hypothetical protein
MCSDEYLGRTNVLIDWGSSSRIDGREKMSFDVNNTPIQYLNGDL